MAEGVSAFHVENALFKQQLGKITLGLSANKATNVHYVAPFVVLITAFNFMSLVVRKR